MTQLRIGSFNVENLFSRVRVFAEGDPDAAGDVLRRIARFSDLLEEQVYDKAKLVAEYNDGRLYEYIRVRCDRVRHEGASPRFFFTDDDGRAKSVNDRINGAGDWSGAIEFHRQNLPEYSREALQRVITHDLRADILCLCEVEDRRTLRMFNEQWLGRAYEYEILVEGNDERGIDVALLSRFPFGTLRSQTFLRDPEERLPNNLPGPMFHRDCLAVEVITPGGVPVHVLCNHFKSKGGGPEAESSTDRKRLAQARAVAKILQETYVRDGQWTGHVVVAGDLNESADRNGANGGNLDGLRTSIDPLITFPGIVNTLADRLPLEQRWTYEFKGRQQQIDYLLLSPGLQDRVSNCGAIYSGRYTGGSNGIVSPLHAASDHAAIWVDVDI